MAVMVAIENSLFHEVGKIFAPLFEFIGWLLALIYGLIPNYAVAIALLTVLIMVVLTPLTIKSTRSMIAMQTLQPELKKLQAKYKGAANRQKLNEEMMALYKQQGINPAGGCLPMFLQMPFLIILYDTLRGLTNVVKGHPQPRYIPKLTGHPATIPLVERLYHNLVHSGGQMVSFGVNFANEPFTHGLSAEQRVPLFALVAIAVALQYFQMHQMTARNRRHGQQVAVNKQMQTIQKFTPILFAYIYFIVPSAVVIYMIVSTLIRLATQDIMFRTGMVKMPGSAPALKSDSSKEGAIDASARDVRTPARSPVAEIQGGSKRNGNGASGRRASPNGNGARRLGNTNGTNEQRSSHPRSKSKKPRRSR
ncbi:MAG: YidC/Oxa1 family membrane protein insertase [Acidimicrobiales bacterium]